MTSAIYCRMSPPVRRERRSLPPPTTDDILTPGSVPVSGAPFGRARERSSKSLFRLLPPKVCTPSPHRSRLTQNAPRAPKPAFSTGIFRPSPGNFPLNPPVIPLFPVNPTSKKLPSQPSSSRPLREVKLPPTLAVRLRPPRPSHSTFRPTLYRHQTPVCAHLCGYVRLIPKKILRPKVDSRRPPSPVRPSSLNPKLETVRPAFLRVSVNFVEAPSLPLRALCASRGESCPTFQNVEKLSFQARVYLFLRESKKKSFHPPVCFCLIFCAPRLK